MSRTLLFQPDIAIPPYNEKFDLVWKTMVKQHGDYLDWDLLLKADSERI